MLKIKILQKHGLPPEFSKPVSGRLAKEGKIKYTYWVKRVIKIKYHHGW